MTGLARFLSHPLYTLVIALCALLLGELLLNCYMSIFEHFIGILVGIHGRNGRGIRGICVCPGIRLRMALD